MSKFIDYKWIGEVEVDLGDIGSQVAYLEVEYETDLNTWRFGSYLLTTKFLRKENSKQVEIEIDITDRITEQALDDIFNQYIVQNQL